MAFWKKSQTQIFLDAAASGATTPTWARLGKSTVLEIALNAQTEDYDFIENENPVSILDNYQPSLGQEIMAEEGDSCFDFIWDKFYNLPVGSDVETDCLIVFPKAGTTSGTFTAWKYRASIVLNSFDAVAKKVTFDIKPADDIVKGTVTVSQGVPTFVAAV